MYETAGERKFKMTEATGSLNKVWGVGRLFTPCWGHPVLLIRKCRCCLWNPERTSQTEACGWVRGGLQQPLWSLGKTLIGLRHL